MQNAELRHSNPGLFQKVLFFDSMRMRFLCLAILSVFAVTAQQRFTLSLTSTENPVIKTWQHAQPFAQDSISWMAAIRLLVQALHEDGYLLTEIKQQQFADNQFLLEIEPNQQVHWASMEFAGLEFLPPHWVHALDLSGEKVSYHRWLNTVNEVLNRAEQDGYLMATYKLEVISLLQDSLFALTRFNPGRRFVLDSIDIFGTARLAPAFLSGQLGLRIGDPITPASLQHFRRQLQQLRFVRQVSPPVIIMFEDKTLVRAFLDSRNASSFDILAGIRPSGEAERAVSITGYVDLNLVNQFSRGEFISIHLERLKPRSQEIEIGLGFPVVFDLPFGIESAFELQKHDTLFTDIRWNAGIVLSVGSNQYIRLGVAQHATNLITVDKQSILTSRRLPKNIDLRINSLTLGLYRNRLDVERNPRQGYSLRLQSAFSEKKVLPNEMILQLNDVDPGFDYRSLYDSAAVAGTKIEVELAGEYFFPLGESATLRAGGDVGIISSDQLLFENELLRLGGYKRLRGFDEESVFAQYYGLASLEYRLLISELGYIAFFGDIAWTDNRDVQVPYADRLYSIGTGINLETRAGVLGLRISAGGINNQGLDLQRARLHVGYTNSF